jgi:hypothetical protein
LWSRYRAGMTDGRSTPTLSRVLRAGMDLLVMGDVGGWVRLYDVRPNPAEDKRPDDRYLGTQRWRAQLHQARTCSACIYPAVQCMRTPARLPWQSASWSAACYPGGTVVVRTAAPGKRSADMFTCALQLVLLHTIARQRSCHWDFGKGL